MLDQIVFFGFGSIAKQHIKILKLIDPNIIFHIVRKKKTINKKNQKLFFYKSFNEIKNISKIKIGFICSPYTEHFNHIKILIKNNINIFVEKPLVFKLEELNEIQKNLIKKKLFLQTGYLFRIHPSLLKIKKLINNKKFGKIINIEANYTSYLPTWRSKNYEHTVSAQKKFGGGVINEIVHEIDYLNYLFNDIKYLNKKVFFLSDLKTDVEERAFIFFKTKTNKNIFLKISFNEKTLVRYLFINFSNGSITWNIINDSIDINKVKNGKLISKKTQYFNTLDTIKFNMFNNLINNIKRKKIGVENFKLEKKTIKTLYDIKKK